MKSSADYTIFNQQYGKRKSAFYREPPRWITALQIFSRNRLEVVSDLLPANRTHILEIGCGNGVFLYENRARWKSVTGVDVVSTQLQKAKSRTYGCKSKFMLEDYGRKSMSFRAGFFDISISIATLQYIYDLDLLFEGIHKVLRKGGLWIFEVPNIAVFWRRIEFLSGSMPRTSHFTNGWDAGVIHYFTVERMKQFCEEKGFRVKKITCSGILSNIRRHWASALGADMIFVCEKI